MPKKVSKPMIEQLYRIYKNVEFSSADYAMYGHGNNAEVVVLDSESEVNTERAYRAENQNYMRRAVRRKQDVDRMWELSKQNSLSEDEKKELNETYSRVMKAMTDPDDPAMKYDDFGHIMLGMEKSGYEYINFDVARNRMMEFNAYNTAKETVNIYQILNVVAKGSNEAKECHRKERELEFAEREFKEKYKGRSLSEAIKRRDILTAEKDFSAEAKAYNMNLDEIRKNDDDLKKIEPMREEAEIYSVAEMKKLRISSNSNAIDSYTIVVTEKEKILNEAKNQQEKLEREYAEISSKIDGYLKLEKEMDEKLKRFEELRIVGEKLNVYRMENLTDEYIEKNYPEIKEFLTSRDIDSISSIPDQATIEGMEAQLKNALDTAKKDISDPKVIERSKELENAINDKKLEIQEKEKQLEEAKSELKSAEKMKEQSISEYNKYVKERNIDENAIEEKIKTSKEFLERTESEYNKLKIKQKELSEKHKAAINSLKQKQEHASKVVDEWVELNDFIEEAKKLHRMDCEVKDAYSDLQQEGYIHVVDRVNECVEKGAKVLYDRPVNVKNHKNSKEYEAMFSGLFEVADPKGVADKQELLGDLAASAKEYLEAKSKQWRPFPSNTRKARMAYAQAIVDFAEKNLNTMKAVNKMDKEIRELEEDVFSINYSKYTKVPEEKYFESLDAQIKPAEIEKNEVEDSLVKE